MTPTREEIIAVAKWRHIPSYPKYEVSDTGLVRRGVKLLSQRLSVKGYPTVAMSISGKSITRVVHALVAEAFIGARPEGFHVCHNDGNKLNNTVMNLRYATPSENAMDKHRHGTMAVGDRNGMRTKPEARPRGELHGKSVLTEEMVNAIKDEIPNWKHGSGIKLAKRFGVHESTISNVKNGKMWVHV